MMIEKQYENVNPCKLQDELIASGLVAGSFITFDLGNDTALIQFNDDVDLDLVEGVLVKHDKTPIPKPKTELELAQETINSLGTQLTLEKIARIQNENTIDTLGKEIVKLKLGGV